MVQCEGIVSLAMPCFVFKSGLHTLGGYSKSDTWNANYRAGGMDKVDNFNPSERTLNCG